VGTNLLYIAVMISRRHPIIFQSLTVGLDDVPKVQRVSTFEPTVYPSFYIQTTPLSYVPRLDTRRVASINFHSQKKINDRHFLIQSLTIYLPCHRCATIVCTVELYQVCNAVKALQESSSYQPWPLGSHCTSEVSHCTLVTTTLYCTTKRGFRQGLA
jgi:hypothetical protein